MTNAPYILNIFLFRSPLLVAFTSLAIVSSQQLPQDI